MEALKWNVLISIVIFGEKKPYMIGRMPWISQVSPKLYWNIAKNQKNDPFNREKIIFKKEKS